MEMSNKLWRYSKKPESPMITGSLMMPDQYVRTSSKTSTDKTVQGALLAIINFTLRQNLCSAELGIHRPNEKLTTRLKSLRKPESSLFREPLDAGSSPA